MASAWHGSQREDGGPQNLLIAHWQISRVHALCGRGEEAIRGGQLCLDISQGEGIDPFSPGYGYEALARGRTVALNKSKAGEWLGKARKTAEMVEDADTQKMLLDDLATVGKGVLFRSGIRKWTALIACQ